MLSRRNRDSEPGIEFVTGDLADGDGIAAAVTRTEITLHCAGSTKGDGEKAQEDFLADRVMSPKPTKVN